MDRVDGLTPEEGEVQDALLDAVISWNALPVMHESDDGEFYAAIHRIQDLLAVRIARRDYPDGWTSTIVVSSDG